jgi:hypothetical protein
MAVAARQDGKKLWHSDRRAWQWHSAVMALQSVLAKGPA